MDKTNVPNISSVLSINYEGETMKIFKASNIGGDLSIPYQAISMESNMRVTSPYTATINEQSARAILNR